jgi:serine/threonine protein kinase
MTEGSGIAIVGEVLAGKYRVDKILGIGGMGMVVAATHLDIDQRVALKFMLPSAHESPEAAARFLREARAAGRLNSDHVCRVIDIGRFAGGAPYIVMEYLQGENLAAVLRRRGPLRVADAVDLVMQAIEGLAEAHAHGIIHRDLKPENLFLAKRNDGGGIVKVLDFGISKVAVTGVATGTGDIMGSPAYMAPEQMQSSRDVDQRADVWSLGVVLYQLVVGKLPFQGDSLPILCMHVVNDAPKPMGAIRGDLPEGFEAAVMRCLCKEPVDRYADVGAMAAALAPFGPAGATTSVSRIQIVLRRARAGSPSAISHEFSTIDPTLDHEQDGEVVELRAPVATTEPPAARPQVTTRAGASGEVRPRDRGGDGRPWGLLGGLGGGLALIALLVVVALRSGGDPGRRDVRPSAAPVAAIPVSPAPSAGAPVAVPAEPSPVPVAEPAVVTAAPAATIEPGSAPGADPVAAPRTRAPGAGAADAGEPSRKPSRPRPRRGAGPAAHPGAGTASAATAGIAPAATPGIPAAGSGSAAALDDDKWTHMTHDEAKP